MWIRSNTSRDDFKTCGFFGKSRYTVFVISRHSRIWIFTYCVYYRDSADLREDKIRFVPTTQYESSLIRDTAYADRDPERGHIWNLVGVSKKTSLQTYPSLPQRAASTTFYLLMTVRYWSIIFCSALAGLIAMARVGNRGSAAFPVVRR